MKVIKRALVSVFDKNNLTEFVKELVNDFGIEILSTGGTGKLLEENGIEYTKISDHTESPEMFDGRVKTLHPKIEGGILFRRKVAKDAQDAHVRPASSLEPGCLCEPKRSEPRST